MNKDTLTLSVENVYLGEKNVEKQDSTAFYYDAIEVRGVADPENVAAKCVAKISTRLDEIYENYAGELELISASEHFRSFSFSLEYKGVEISKEDLKRLIVEVVTSIQG
jgi:hypothetical protein